MCTLSFCYNVIHPLNLIENKHFKWTANNPIKSPISSSIRRVQLWIVNMNVFGGDKIKIASGSIKIRIWIKMPDILSVTPLWCDMILIACWDIDFPCQILFQREQITHLVNYAGHQVLSNSGSTMWECLQVTMIQIKLT